MSMDQIVYLFLALGMFVGYFAGKLRGEIKQQDLWRNHMEKCSRYMRAVDDLDKWCGHCSPHARLIARHIRAHGEGEGCNSGTPVGDEPCTISGLREQLKRLSQEVRVPLDRIARDLLLDVKNRVNALVLLTSSERRESEIRIKQDIADFLAAPPAQEARVPLPKCWCRACRPITFDDMRFVVCPTCGNKRCPKANDHRNTCTDSNEPGQDGSAYPAMVCITAAQKETP